MYAKCMQNIGKRYTRFNGYNIQEPYHIQIMKDKPKWSGPFLISQLTRVEALIEAGVIPDISRNNAYRSAMERYIEHSLNMKRLESQFIKKE